MYKRQAYKNLLENTALLSPINGVVTARNYDNGDMYSGGNPVLVVEPVSYTHLFSGYSGNQKRWFIYRQAVLQKNIVCSLT